MGEHTDRSNGGVKYLTRQETSQYLADIGIPYAVATLASAAVYGRGPVFHLFNRKPLYAVNDIDAWIVAQLGTAANSTTAHDAMRGLAGEP